MKITMVVLVLIGLLALGGWFVYGRKEAPQDGAYHTIKASQAKERMDSGDPITVVDVREKDEYAGGHIAGAINIPLGTIGSGGEAVLTDKNAEILVYCRSGNRSRQAAEKLVALGYTAIYDFGGITDWTFGTVTE